MKAAFELEVQVYIEMYNEEPNKYPLSMCLALN